MGSRFAFLKRDFPTLFEKGAQAEVVEDVSVALLKVRQGLELIVKELGVDGRDLFNNINSLSDEGILNEKLTQLFHKTRICANKGVHSEVVVKEADRKFAVDSFLEICIWYGACYKNKEYCLENFNSEDVLIAKKYIFKDDDYQGESLGTVIKVVDPLGVSMGFSFEEDDEVDVLERDVFETEAEYKVRIANLPPVHIGYAILDTRKSDGYTKVQFLQHHIDRNLTVNFTENEVYFFVDNLKPCGVIDGELKAGIKVIDNKVCCDYKRVVLCSEDKEVHVNFICWSKIETESKEEFEKCIEDLPVLPLAVCKPVRNEYDIEKEILPFIVAKFNFSSPIVMNNKMSIHCPRNKARLICEQKLPFYVFGKVGSDLSMLVYHIWNESLGLVHSRDVVAENLFNCYLQKAEQGDVAAQNSLGKCYYEGKGVSQDYAKAVKWYTRVAEQGNVAAQNNLGDCYYEGKGVSQNYANVVEWYVRAVWWGDVAAQNSLGKCYYEGKGVSENYIEAVKWYTKAAEQGNVEAQNSLGDCYYEGKGVSQDYAEAVKWYTKAAEQGNAYAQKHLGDCYYNGDGVVQDYAEAVKWYEKAAEQGNVTAQNNLGKCYYAGKGVSQDYAEAVKWYTKAAEQGDINAQYMLGKCYYERGYPKTMPKQ